MSEKILFVDDEPAVLDGYRRVLPKEYQLSTANGGEEALALIQSSGPFAVIVSDMRMPGMTGVQLLARVHDIAPETVRMVLSGFADFQSAMDAVNEGHIFRFLNKPCDATTLKKALTSALMQYRLVIAEKELLENTLMGSIKVLTEVLSLANPAAFGRSTRIRRYVMQMVNTLQLEAPWRYEVAAMLSQLGCITLDQEVIEIAYCGKALSGEEQARYDKHPSVAHDLLRNIPRLEGIAWMIGKQQNGAASSQPDPPESIRLGADILRVAIAFDNLKIQGKSDPDAIEELQKNKQFEPRLIKALASLPQEAVEMETRAIEIADLEAGMILQEEIRTQNGLLLVAKGQEVTFPLLVRLRNFHQLRTINPKLLVLAPRGRQR